MQAMSVSRLYANSGVDRGIPSETIRCGLVNVAEASQTMNAPANRVVVLEPLRQLRDDGLGIRARGDTDIITLEGSDEGIGHAIGLRAFDWRRQRLLPDMPRKAEEAQGEVRDDGYRPEARNALRIKGLRQVRRRPRLPAIVGLSVSHDPTDGHRNGARLQLPVAFAGTPLRPTLFGIKFRSRGR